MDETREGEVLHCERQAEGESEAWKCLNRSYVYEDASYWTWTALLWPNKKLTHPGPISKRHISKSAPIAHYGATDLLNTLGLTLGEICGMSRIQNCRGVLPSPLCLFSKSPLSNCQVHITVLVFPYLAISSSWLFLFVNSPLPLGCWRPELFFMVCPKFCPQVLSFDGGGQKLCRRIHNHVVLQK